ncbi:hypothetical protein H2201_000672 [Coniosporium apollinis]|uniref:Uncharacterized protein n=2 Tax=Coniosporium TaxID=2810619 RepID=A0ABQ9P469_9PEZI|nr:hypothetical protein H2199_002633 [Cladosporium sp. JES 115]KAJ9669320.1 hypothetical protein H2201_000672 [Coniosporium apollinis]
MPRLGHRKSRNGCTQCKRRRVKGDAVNTPVADPIQQSTNSSVSGSTVPTLVVSAPQDPNPPDVLSYFMIEADSAPYTDWIESLELMHHYSTSTYLSLSNQKELQHILQVDIPREAFAQKFLMHGILALSALHLAHKQPDRPALTTISTHHQNLAISGFRTALAHIAGHNANAVFALSSFITLLAFANLAKFSTTHKTDCIDSFAEIFMLLRGVREIVISARDWVIRGPLVPLLMAGRLDESQSPMHPNLQDRLDKLTALVADDRFDAETKTLCADAMAHLKPLFARVLAQTGRTETSVLMTWPVIVPLGFITLIRQRHPAALIILGHYCVLFHLYKENWFVDRCGARIVGAIIDALDEEWQQWMSWPAECVALDVDVGVLNTFIGTW